MESDLTPSLLYGSYLDRYITKCVSYYVRRHTEGGLLLISGEVLNTDTPIVTTFVFLLDLSIAFGVFS